MDAHSSVGQSLWCSAEGKKPVSKAIFSVIPFMPQSGRQKYDDGNRSVVRAGVGGCEQKGMAHGSLG